MGALTRRAFLRSSAAGMGLGLGLAGCASTVTGDIAPKSGRRVVVIGGGWGGATAARYVRMVDPSIEVVLLEPNRDFISCPFSNLVLSGLRTHREPDAILRRSQGPRRPHHQRDGNRHRARHQARAHRRRLSRLRPARRLARHRLPVGSGRGAAPPPRTPSCTPGRRGRRQWSWRARSSPCRTAASSSSPCRPSPTDARPVHTSASARSPGI